MRLSRLGALGNIAILLGLSCESPSDVEAPRFGIAFEAPGLLAEEAPAPAIRAQRSAPAPFSLTASDGTGLVLGSLRSRTVIEGPLALTELELSFDNPEARTLEGRFAITLPEGASVSRFAMEIAGAWQEAEVVEKQKARQTYETFLHERKDPALLEQGAGNQFSARVFPIPAKATKRLVLTYAEVLDAAHPFEVRLLGLPEMRELDVRVTADGEEIFSMHEKGYLPTTDFVAPRGTDLRDVGLAHAESMVLRGVVPDGKQAADPLQNVLILVDTSAARALDLQRELDGLDALVRAMPGETRVSIATFDQEVSLVFQGEASGVDEQVLRGIEARNAFGATNFDRALRFAGGLATTTELTRLVFVSDGIVTSGPATIEALTPTLEALASVGIERIDALAIGALRDRAFLEKLAGAGARRGTVGEVDAPSEVTLARLGRAPLAALDVRVPGATWQSPRTLEGLSAGDEFVVFAKVPDAEHASRIAVGVGEEEISVELWRAQSAELVERAHAVAEIAELEAGETSDATKARIVALSTKHRVLSRETAMVVLETHEDYARFGIDRDATVDILGIEDDAIVTRKGARVDLKSKQDGAKGDGRRAPSRADTSARAMPPTLADSSSGGLGLSGIGEGGGGRGDGIGLGGIGTIGGGADGRARGEEGTMGGPGTGTGQGFGNGNGRLGGSHRSRPPSIRMGATTVQGRLPPEVIQRIVRQNFGRFRLCYEKGLQSNPNLQGQITVAFVIGRDGALGNSSVQRSTLPDLEVNECVKRAFLTLAFPPPDGGVVRVSYPISFAPGDGPLMPAWTFPHGPPPMPLPPSAYEGRFRTVMDELGEGEGEAALGEALAWASESPSDVLAFVAVGEAAEATGRPRLAARAYGSILDLWAYRVEMKRFAAQRLERIGTPDALEIASAAFASAIADRPDHPSGYRLLAYAAFKRGAPNEAFETVEKALQITLPSGRYAGVRPLLEQDASLLAHAWAAQEPSKTPELASRLDKLGLAFDRTPSIRFVLSWETDANDVDLHVNDAKGNHAFYSSPKLETGGRLLADVTTGYGPEGFVIPEPSAFPYTLRANYYSRGVMGFGMGKVQVVRHDGKGGLTIEEKPFVIQTNHGDVELGTVTAE